MVGEDEVAATLAAGQRPALERPAALVELANDAGGRDNITVVLFRLEELELGRRRTTATSAGAAALRSEDVRRAVDGVRTTREVAPPIPRPAAEPPSRAAPRPGRDRAGAGAFPAA